jgi:hypothetical protein
MTGDADAEGLTQRDWMVSLVDAAGWSFGLPDEPQDPDYINILSGNRVLRVEAEDAYAKEKDSVSFMSFRNFGNFSGEGWLNGSRTETDVHLSFILPVDGLYQLKAKLRRAGHKVTVNGQTIPVDAEEMFTSVEIGEFQLQAGPQEIVVTLPAGGSIDYISLEANNLAAITPEKGWQPDESLSWEDVQTTLLQLMQLAEVFPLTEKPLQYEAESLQGKQQLVVDIPHLGVPSEGKWLRAGPTTVEIVFPLDIPSSGFYDLDLRLMGSPIDITVGGHESFRLDARSYLDDFNFKSLFLHAGQNKVSVTIPPGGGVDWLRLTQRKVTPSGAMTLLGQASSAAPTAADLDGLVSLLATFGTAR